jgi:hypothetical protein
MAAQSSNSGSFFISCIFLRSIDFAAFRGSGFSSVSVGVFHPVYFQEGHIAVLAVFSFSAKACILFRLFQ